MGKAPTVKFVAILFFSKSPSIQADQLGEKVAEFAVSVTTKLRGLFLVDDLSDSLKVGRRCSTKF